MKISQAVLMLQSGHENVVEMAIFNVQRAITPKNTQSKVAVFALCTLSYRA